MSAAGMFGKMAIIIVTYRRNALLRVLFESLASQTRAPAWIVVVDNDGEAGPLVDEVRPSLPQTHIEYRHPDTNLGGAGGFALGVETAMELGAEWLWFMDDDVMLLPEAHASVERWAEKHRFFIGRRQNRDGSEFFYQPRFNEFLAVPVPDFRFDFARSDEFFTDVVSFEGCVVHRTIVEKIGIPDARFFLSWDDIIYGWLAAHHTPVAIVSDFLLRRTQDVPTIRFLGRQVAKPSHLYVFHFFKNRRLVKEYFKKYRGYHPVGFRLGTIVLVGKELYRGAVTGELMTVSRLIAKGLLSRDKAEGVAL
jgi:glycosyltransferase involved in cell wall biosynthesis